MLYIQSCDDTLSWVIIALGSTYLLGRWCRPYQISCFLFCLSFVARKSKGSYLLWRSILIWHKILLSCLIVGVYDAFSSYSILGVDFDYTIGYCLPLYVYLLDEGIFRKLLIVCMIIYNYHYLFLSVCLKILNFL